MVRVTGLGEPKDMTINNQQKERVWNCLWNRLPAAGKYLPGLVLGNEGVPAPITTCGGDLHGRRVDFPLGNINGNSSGDLGE